jgi:c-di-GMP-binding flagellar brake protein YcgR
MVYTVQERREFIRVTLSLPVRYSVVGLKQGYTESHTEDISTGGLRLVLKEALAVGTLLKLELELLKEEKTVLVNLQASIVWVNPVPSNLEYPYKAGVKFIDIGIDERMFISNCIYYRAELLKKPFR